MGYFFTTRNGAAKDDPELIEEARLISEALDEMPEDFTSQQLQEAIDRKRGYAIGSELSYEMDEEDTSRSG